MLGQRLDARKVGVDRLGREPLVQHERVAIGVFVELGERRVALGRVVLQKGSV